jgi:hypothetical protein
VADAGASQRAAILTIRSTGSEGRFGVGAPRLQYSRPSSVSRVH